jgi:hypothetical protein
MEQPNIKPKTRKTSEIMMQEWGYLGPNGEEVPCEPTPQEILDALQKRRFEKRPFTEHREELKKEWLSGLPQAFPENEDEFIRRSKTYHARRVAYFMAHGWDGEPIDLDERGKVVDGLHRYKAAALTAILQHREVEIEIRIIPNSALPPPASPK